MDKLVNRSLRLEVPREGEGGTGLYLGADIMLTNHHMVSNSWRAGMLAGRPLMPAENWRQMITPGENEELRRGHYCTENNGTTVHLRVTPEPLHPLCIPVDASTGMTATFERTAQKSSTELLFTSEELDLAVLRLDKVGIPSTRLLPPAAAVPVIGDPVFIGSYGDDRWSVAICSVETGIQPTRDEDPRIPENQRWTLPSLIVYCPTDTVTYGSSGAGVYDQAGGLVGLVWSGSVDRNRVFVTPVAAWRERLLAAPALADTRMSTWLQQLTL
jgi:hypothetical protein